MPWSQVSLFYWKGCVPFEDAEVSKLYEKILEGKFYMPPILSPELKDLLFRMIEINPSKRITLQEIQ